MVCETSAWGRAIVAVLAADAKKVATIDEVRNRAEVPVRAVAPKPTAKVVAPKPSGDEPQTWVPPKQKIVKPSEMNEASIHAIAELAKQAGIDSKEEMREYCSMVIDRDIASSLDLTAEDRVKVIMALRELVMDPKE
jgi:galactose-1-phosphate uridylyltransferase